MTRGSKPKPLPEHGTYARFVGRPARDIKGCKCVLCAEAGRRYCMRRNFLRATGKPLTVSSSQAAAHLRHLFEGGAGFSRVVRASGCSTSMIQAIMQGRSMIHRRTEQRILAVHLDQVISPQRLVPSIGATRRVRALFAIGHPASTIAKAAGIGADVLANLAAGSVDQVKARTHDATQRAFAALAMTPGTSSRSLNRARQEGWAPPLAWDDIDDPAAIPQYGERTESRGLAIVEDTAELALLGYDRHAIAGRLGVTWEAVHRAHRRAGTEVPRILTAA